MFHEARRVLGDEDVATVPDMRVEDHRVVELVALWKSEDIPFADLRERAIADDFRLERPFKKKISFLGERRLILQ